MTICEKKSGFDGVKVNWIGPITNVTRSWIEIANLNLGINLSIFTNNYYIDEYNKKCEKYNTSSDLEKIKIYNNIKEISRADVVITDTWESMGEEVHEKIISELSQYTINERMMNILGDDCIFMHCLPAKRGQEVTSDVIDGPQSVVWDEAQNRFHIQKEILKWCL